MEHADYNRDEQQRTEHGLKELCKLIAETQDIQLLEEFFSCLFSKAEIKDIVNRWLLVQEIDKGMTQRDIAKKYSISLCKITRGSRELKKENSAFRHMLEINKKIKARNDT